MSQWTEQDDLARFVHGSTGLDPYVLTWGDLPLLFDLEADDDVCPWCDADVPEDVETCAVCGRNL